MPNIVINGGSSGANDHALIQNALDAVAAGGGVVSVPDGTYVLSLSLTIGDNTHLELGRGTTLIRDFVGGDVLSTIRNSAHTSGTNTNIRVSGGVLKSNTGKTGKHLAFRNVAQLSVTGMQLLSCEGDWNTSFVDCEDVVITGVVIRGGVGANVDGLHFAGGRRIAISDCLVESIDDSLSLLNESASKPLKPIEDVVISNCYLYSRKVQAVKIQVMQAEFGWTPTAIRRVSLSNIVAKTGDGTGNPVTGGGIYINAYTTAGDLITDVEINGFWLDASQNGGKPIDIQNAKRVRLHHVVAIKPEVRAEIDGSTDVELNDCVIDSPRGTGNQCLLVAGEVSCANIRIIGGAYLNAKHNAVQLGTSAWFVNGFEVRGTLIVGNESSTLVGLYIAKASDGLVSNNTIRNCTSWGIYEDPALASSNLLLGNRLFNDNTGNPAGPISFGGANSQAIRNVADATVKVADSGGFRQTIDGWTQENVAASQTDVELSRNNFTVPGGGAGRFRAVRAGSITGICVTSTVAAGTGTLTVTVFKNATGTAGSTGSTTLFSTTLTSGQTRNSATQAENLDTFIAGDELYIVVTTTGTWNATSADIRCALEIEN